MREAQEKENVCKKKKKKKRLMIHVNIEKLAEEHVSSENAHSTGR